MVYGLGAEITAIGNEVEVVFPISVLLQEPTKRKRGLWEYSTIFICGL